MRSLFAQQKKPSFQKEGMHKEVRGYSFDSGLALPGVLPLELESSLEGSPASGSASPALAPSALSASVGSVGTVSPPQPTLRKAAIAKVIEIVIIVFFMIG